MQHFDSRRSGSRAPNKPLLSLGSLCTGYGGLDMALMKTFRALNPALRWVADNNKHASTLLQKRLPTVPNLGDLERVDWQLVDPVDAVCAGFPCQDISFAGQGAGIAHCVGD
jgi:DNA (cytosine-5)-methyltransferase 1